MIMKSFTWMSPIEKPGSMNGDKSKKSYSIFCWFLLILFAGTQMMFSQLTGTVDAGPPDQGFEVDGNLLVGPVNGDWFLANGAFNPGAPVQSVLHVDAGEVKPMFLDKTFIFRDGVPGVEAGDLTIFASSNAINDDPNTYQWGAGSSPPKDEIQNCFVHFAEKENLDGKNDIWMYFAGDRATTNGNAYIDFEFLQKKLTMNPDGTFTS